MPKQVTDGRRFGVAEVRGIRVVGIEEKPKALKSDLAVTASDRTVFEKIHGLKPSSRGELEITDVNNSFKKLALVGTREH